MSLLSAGLRLQDRYVVRERFGVGGMSEVWRATDELLGREVAVKVLAASLVGDPSLRKLLRREAQAAARLSHPYVTAVHDYGEATLDDGRLLPYLVLELVAGQTLAQRLEREGPLPWPEAAQVVGQIAEALAAAHALGVVHRDVKPGNVMLTGGGVKVLDFGVAAVTGGVDTDPGRLLGTPRYVAPERLDPTYPAAPAGDVYSLGVLLYEVIVGRPPVQIVDWAQAAAVHRTGAVPSELDVPGLPAELARLCQACLAADPRQRPDAAEVARTLAGLRPGTPQVDPDPTVPVSAVSAGDGTGLLRYAMGSAPLPAPPTPATRPDDRSARRRLPIFQVALAVTAVAVLLALALLLGKALRSPEGSVAGPDRPGSVEQSEVAGPPGGSPEASPEGQPDGPERPPGNPFAGAVGVIQALERTVIDGAQRGLITRGAAEEVQDYLGELREAMAERDPEEFVEVAGELREEIEELRVDGELDPQMAADLTRLVADLPLL